MAQQTNDTLQLKTVEITTQKPTEVTPLGLHNATSITQSIQNNTPYFIKQSSPGMLATLSIRGSTASQINTLWQGVKINNTMLGQNDISLLQGNLFGGSTLNESAQSTAIAGGLGGSLAMATNPKDTNILKLYTSLNTFNNTNNALQVRLGKQRVKSFTHLSYNYDLNNYNFINTTDYATPTTIIQTNAQSTSVNVYEELRYAYHRLNVTSSFWYNYTKRTLPAAMGTTYQYETQQDSSLRGVVNVNYSCKNNQYLSATVALMQELLNYQNKVLQLYSTNNITTAVGILNYKKIVRSSQFNITSSNYNYTANTSNYSSVKHQYENTVALNFSTPLTSHSQLAVNVTQQFINYGYTPTIASLAYGVNYSANIKIMATVGNNYRYPTLNDKYWSLGGNPNLKPEEVTYGELKINYLPFNNQFKLVLGLDPYYKKLTNMIQWLPSTTNGIWTPTNVKTVAQYGYDARALTNYKLGKYTFAIEEFLGYNKSIVLQSTTANDASVGRQLIYSPIFQLKSNVSIQYNNIITLRYTHISTSWRATSADNYSYLPFYAVSNATLEYTTHYKQHSIKVQCLVNNIFNSNYSIVAARPQPLRNYGVQLIYTL